MTVASARGIYPGKKTRPKGVGNPTLLPRTRGCNRSTGRRLEKILPATTKRRDSCSKPLRRSLLCTTQTTNQHIARSQGTHGRKFIAAKSHRCSGSSSSSSSSSSPSRHSSSGAGQAHPRTRTRPRILYRRIQTYLCRMWLTAKRTSPVKAPLYDHPEVRRVPPQPRWFIATALQPLACAFSFKARTRAKQETLKLDRCNEPRVSHVQQSLTHGQSAIAT